MEDQSAAVARRLQHAERGAIALVPVPPEVDTRTAVLNLARALVRVGAERVAIVDAASRWPVGPEDPSEDAIFTRRQVEGIPVLAPRVAGAAAMAALKRLLESRVRPFRHLLVDLSGLEAQGEHLAAAALSDGVVLVAEAGRTREADLEAVRRELMPSQLVGVVLVG